MLLKGGDKGKPISPTKISKTIVFLVTPPVGMSIGKRMRKDIKYQRGVGWVD